MVEAELPRNRRTARARGHQGRQPCAPLVPPIWRHQLLYGSDFALEPSVLPWNMHLYLQLITVDFHRHQLLRDSEELKQRRRRHEPVDRRPKAAK